MEWALARSAARRRQPPVTGKNAPFWLADLAELVTGAELVSSLETSDEETTSLSRDQITESAPREVQGEYKKIWQRFEPILAEDW
jgi:hypothetical protein